MFIHSPSPQNLDLQKSSHWSSKAILSNTIYFLMCNFYIFHHSSTPTGQDVSLTSASTAQVPKRLFDSIISLVIHTNVTHAHIKKNKKKIKKPTI